jgi:hypothetical protein
LKGLNTAIDSSREEEKASETKEGVSAGRVQCGQKIFKLKRELLFHWRYISELPGPFFESVNGSRIDTLICHKFGQKG